MKRGHQDNTIPKVIVRKVIEVRSRIGQGTADDPVRILTSLYTTDGTFLAYYDPLDDDDVPSTEEADDG